jgi:alpha-D-xyloside xylohydrolase
MPARWSSSFHVKSLPPRPSLAALALTATCLVAGTPAPTPAAEIRSPAMTEEIPNGVIIPLEQGLLRLELCAENIVRVAFARDRAFFSRESLSLDPARPRKDVAWKLEETPSTITLATSRLSVRIDRASGRVAFFDAAGRPVLAERTGGRTLEAAEVQGEKTFHVRQAWEPRDDESLHGLGCHHLGLMDIKGYDLDLWQHNGTIALPFLVSSAGYGIFWDNPSYTRFGDLRQPEPPPAARLFGVDGKPGGLTGSYFADGEFRQLVATRVDDAIDITPPPPMPRPAELDAPQALATSPDQSGATPPPSAAAHAWATRNNRHVHPALDVTGNISVRWEGFIEPEVSGDHTLHTFSNCGLKVWVDDRLVIDHWRQGWLPWKDVARIRLEAGRRHKLRVEWVRDDNPPRLQVKWKTPPASADTSLWSEVGEGTDYYLVFGPRLDDVIAGYRQLTGPARLLPKWAFGLWQSRQRYETQQTSIDVVAEFRRRGIPLDVIVQDWFYWTRTGWGSHEFDPERFPDPDGWIRTLHEKHNARLLLSVWPKFYPGTANFDAFKQRGWLYQPNLDQGIRDWTGGAFTYYDAFNADARRLYWAQIERALFRRGVDAWWLDGTEPDLLPSPTLEGAHTHMMPTAGGTAARVLNAFPLQNARAVYEGQRGTAPDQRVVILTRSGFAGQQRFAGAVWSGDISSTWTAMAKQIPAALGWSLSGMPYWTMDVGGFSVPDRFKPENARPEDIEEWRELNTRWFQFGTFVPMLRIHGERPWREMWEFGGEAHPACQTQLKFDRLRYRMLPYIYSVAGAVTSEGASFLRPLVMDFPGDTTARAIGDQYLFGPALLVSPVTSFGARSRAVYLPATAGGWYDFWTGANLPGGRTIDAPAPYEALPLHVRAGSIVPYGPEMKWAMEKPDDPITLTVYTGANGSFTLYDDDGLTNGYERGLSSRIPLRWDEATRTLTIGAREGTFPGMLAERTFAIVFVSPQKPVGFSFAPVVDQTLRYSGDALTVRGP